MAVYTLNGSGTRALSANVVQVRVEILALPPGATTGHAAPIDYFGVGFLRFGVQGSYLRKLPIDGFDILLDVPANATTIGWYLFPAGSIRVTEQFDQGAGNPSRVLVTSPGTMAGNAAAAVLCTYTVPSNRMASISQGLIAVGNGQAQAVQLRLNLNNNPIGIVYGVASGSTAEFARDKLTVRLNLSAGDVLQVVGWNGNAGAVAIACTIGGIEFDALAWVPTA